MKFITTHHRTGPETMSRSETHPALPLVFGFRSVVRSLNSGGSEKDDWTRSNSASSSPRSMPEWVTPAASSARFISAMDGLVFEGGTDLGCLLADGAPSRSAPFLGRFAARSSPDAGSPPAWVSPTIKTSSFDPDIAEPSFDETLRRTSLCGGDARKVPNIPPLRSRRTPPEPLFADISRIFSATIVIGCGPKLTANAFTPE